jgi:hypothetical protein
MLTNSEHILQVGPPALALSAAEMNDFLIARRTGVEMALRKKERYGETSLTELELCLAETAHFATMTMYEVPGLGAYAESTEDPVVVAIRAMMLEDNQIEELIKWFVEFWHDPAGEYVHCRSIELGGQAYRVVYVGCPPDCDDEDSLKLWRLDRVLLNGLGTQAGLHWADAAWPPWTALH